MTKVREITSFDGEYEFLSNFFRSEVEFEGDTYPTVEYAFQAAKTLDPVLRQEIRTADGPGRAKKLGRKVLLRPDWERVKGKVMRELLFSKFRGEELKNMLLDTGDARLIEGNDWGDREWGCVWEDGRWAGNNKLGRLLMEVRSQISEGKVVTLPADEDSSPATMPDGMLVLETMRLILRPFDLSDAAAVQFLAGDRAVADTTLNIPYPYEDGMAEKWISTHQPKYKAGELANFAITMKGSEILIGAIGLVIEKRFNRAELGYWVGKPYWGQGYCTEAGLAIIEFGFSVLGLNRIHATHLVRNPASGRVMQKLGMNPEGILRQHVKKWDRYEDVVVCGIIMDERGKLGT